MAVAVAGIPYIPREWRDDAARPELNLHCMLHLDTQLLAVYEMYYYSTCKCALSTG